MNGGELLISFQLPGCIVVVDAVVFFCDGLIAVHDGFSETVELFSRAS